MKHQMIDLPHHLEFGHITYNDGDALFLSLLKGVFVRDGTLNNDNAGMFLQRGNRDNVLMHLPCDPHIACRTVRHDITQQIPGIASINFSLEFLPSNTYILSPTVLRLLQVSFLSNPLSVIFH